MADSVFILVVVLGAGGLGLVAYGLAAMVAPEWAAAHQWHLLSVAGLVPFILAVGRGVRVYQRLGVDIWLDRARAKANDLVNQAREVELRLAERIEATDDDAPDPEPRRLAAWDATNITLFVGGDKAGGYSQPKMSSMISSDPWQAWTNFYADNPEAEPVFQRVPGKVGTKLHFRWPLTRVLFAIARGELPTPPGPPPSVREYTPENRAAEKAESSGEAIVEGVARKG